MKNLLQLHFYAEKEGKKHASLWVNLLCGSLAIYSLLRPGKLNQSCGSNPPTATFFRLLCFVHLPQKVRGIFALKMRKTGSAAVRSTTAEPVFVDFTVFWAIFALKARKLPDLSGRQIRQLIWSVRPIKMFAKTLYLQGFAGQRRLFFLFFGWDLADFLPKGDFSVRPKKISAYSYFFSF